MLRRRLRAPATLAWVAVSLTCPPMLGAESDQLAPESSVAGLPAQTTPLDTSSNGVYGRFDGDLELSAGVGSHWGESSRSGVRLSAHYFSTVGLWALAMTAHEKPPITPFLAMGIELRPGFLPRWALGKERGPAFLDLTLDSIALGLGAYRDAAQQDWAERSWASKAGSQRRDGDSLGMLASFGLGLPLMASAPGLWLETRTLLQIPDATRLGTRVGAELLLSWHWFTISPWQRRQSRPPRW
jgi:hypothetical protein